jgi:hypothetical protein
MNFKKFQLFLLISVWVTAVGYSHKCAANPSNEVKELAKLLLANDVRAFVFALAKLKTSKEDIIFLFEKISHPSHPMSVEDERKGMTELMKKFSALEHDACINKFVNPTNLIIRPDGVEKVIDVLLSKSLTPITVPAKATNNVSAAVGELVDKAKDKRSLNQVIIFNRENGPYVGQGAHTSMLLISKNDKDECRVVHIDSTINENYSSAPFMAYLMEIPKQWNCKYFDFGSERQADSTNCPVFAISDYLEINRDQETLFQYATVYTTRDGTTTCDANEENRTNRLPPNLMAVTQSMKRIQKYIEDHRNNNLVGDISLLSAVRASKVASRESSDKLVNATIHNRLKEYLLILLKSCLTKN